jgi:hypothetical protein
VFYVFYVGFIVIYIYYMGFLLLFMYIVGFIVVYIVGFIVIYVYLQRSHQVRYGGGFRNYVHIYCHFCDSSMVIQYSSKV